MTTVPRVGGIDAEVGLTESKCKMPRLKKKYQQARKEVIVLADSSKFQQVAFSFYAGLDKIDHLICEKLPPEPLLGKLKQNEITVHVVSEKEEQII